MKNRNIKKLYIAVLAALFIQLGYQSQAQEIKKDVTVVKAYQPVIQDADKINLLPAFNDTLKISPQFNYNIQSVKIATPFVPRPVSAARMVAEPLKNLYNSYIKLGVGAPLSPLAELSLSNLRSKDKSYGLFVQHRSINGKIKLDNDHKVDAPFSNTTIEGFGKRIYSQSVVSGNVAYGNESLKYYGYSTDAFPDDEPDMPKQLYHKVNANVAVESLETDSNKLYYNLNGKYDYILDKFENSDNLIGVNGSVAKQVNNFYLGTEASVDYAFAGATNDTTTNSIVNIKPFLSKSKGDWRFKIGLNGAFDNTQQTSNFYAYPVINFDFIIARNVIAAFVGYDGYLEQNNLSRMITINPFLLPGQRVKNTNHKSRIYGGLKGCFSSAINYVVSASYSSINNQYFFINDTINPAASGFIPVYDDVELFNVNLETTIKASEKLSFLAKANFNKYSMFKLDKPYLVPNFDISLSAKYNLRDKILVNADVFFAGQRYAAEWATAQSIVHKPYSDFNLGFEYRYSKILSLFLQFKNLTATRYEYWNQYPVYRFQLLGGFTYSL